MTVTDHWNLNSATQRKEIRVNTQSLKTGAGPEVNNRNISALIYLPKEHPSPTHLGFGLQSTAWKHPKSSCQWYYCSFTEQFCLQFNQVSISTKNSVKKMKMILNKKSSCILNPCCPMASISEVKRISRVRSTTYRLFIYRDSNG